MGGRVYNHRLIPLFILHIHIRSTTDEEKGDEREEEGCDKAFLGDFHICYGSMNVAVRISGFSDSSLPMFLKMETVSVFVDSSNEAS